MIFKIGNIKIRISHDVIVALVIALSPILSVIKSPLSGYSFSEISLLIISPFVLLRGINDRKKFNKRINIALILFVTFAIISLPLSSGGMTINSIFNVIFLSWFIVVFLILGVYSTETLKMLYKTIVFVAILSTIGICIQYIGYYFLGSVIRFIPNSWYQAHVLSDYEYMFKYGLDNGFFRPSAFFIEPSSLARYGAVALFLVLFCNKFETRKVICIKAITITIGVLMSTSGMGIVFSGVLWLLYVLMEYRALTVKKLIIGLLLIIVGFLSLKWLFSNVEFLANSLQRITGSGLKGYNAVQGRLEGLIVFKDWTMSELFLGQGMGRDPSIYLTGIMMVVYRWGLFGLIPFVCGIYWSNTTNNKLIVSSMVLGLYISSNLLTVPNIVFYFSVILIPVFWYGNQEVDTA